MKVCDLNTGVGQLSLGFSQLKERWQAAKGQWRDEAAEQFEEKHLATIPPHLQLLMAAVHRLADVVAKAERDCEDRGDAP